MSACDRRDKASCISQVNKIEAAQCSRAQAIHPCYGFLSENAAFARAVIEAGLTWIGPSPEAIEAMGDKVNARNLLVAAGVPVSQGTAEPVCDTEAALAAGKTLGYPLMVKAALGGGGIGMSAVEDERSLLKAFHTASSRAERFFGSAAILLERYVPHARHVEIQILGLANGHVIALGERDCSVQRRHQKIAEETPSPGVTPQLRQRMIAAAIRAGEAVHYQGAGTVECLVDSVAQDYVFLEMNTRLQVEHPITELVTGTSQGAVTGFRIEGVKTNLAFFNELLKDPAYVSGNYDTGIVEALRTRRGARIVHIGQPDER